MALTRVINEGIGSASAIAGEGTATTNLQQGLAKAWFHIPANGASILDSFNVSSLTDTATGQFSVVINNDMGNANYACGDGSVNKDSSRITGLAGTNNAYAAGSAREIFQVTNDGESDAATPDNANPVRLTYFGDLA